MENKYYFYRDRGKIKQINLDDIAFLVTVDNLTHFYIEGDKLEIRVTLTDAMRLLPQNRFLRISRSTAVAMQYIDYIFKDSVFTKTEPVHELTINSQYLKQLPKQVIILETDPNKAKRTRAMEESE